MVMEEPITNNSLTASFLTGNGEPILRLCATSNQFKALVKLVEFLKDKRQFGNLIDRLVKLKDSNDWTILHLLSAKEEVKV